jgi:DNA polymerase IV
MNIQDQPPLAAKVAYFAQLKTLSSSGSDDSLDVDERERRLAHKRFFELPPPPFEQRAVIDVETERVTKAFHTAAAPPEAVATPSQRRNATAPDIIKATQSGAKQIRNRVTELLGDEGQDVVGETPLARDKRTRDGTTGTSSAAVSSGRQRLLRAQTDSPSVTSSATTAAARKRKRTSEPVLRPQGDLLFRDLVFYYIPDNDIAPARRLRISKAREYGATWTRDVRLATHVVVDRDVGYKDVKALLDKNGVYEEQAVVVGEDYPVDCLRFRAVLDPRQRKYLVSGQTLEREEKEGSNEKVQEAGEEAKDVEHDRRKMTMEVLKLKEPQRNPAKWDYVPPKGTPDRSAPSSAQDGTPIATPPAVDSQPISLGVEEQKDELAGTADGAMAAKDELSSYISMVQEFKNLPLDNDDEDETASTVGHEEEKSGSDEETASKTRSRRKDTTFEQRFACNRAGTKDVNDNNPNERTIQVLQQMHAYYERVSDQWRTIAYRKAMATLKRQPERITTEEEAVRLPGIGRRLAQKIEEIATTDGLRRLEYAEQDGMDGVLKLFLGVYGVGPKLARQWAAQGHRTLEDLKRHVKLTPSQLMGIERYQDLSRKIPRDEVRELGEAVRGVARGVDAEVEMIIGGSYRRGANESNDIDFIVTKPGTTSSGELRPFLDEVVHRLERDEIIVARLASRGGGSGSIWHGCCILPRSKEDATAEPVWRRIDFLLVPESEMGGALIYFTGDDVFNRSMRLLARKKGMRLNQNGLYKRGIDGLKVVEAELVEGRSERRIFEILGVQWREPWERWC